MFDRKQWCTGNGGTCYGSACLTWNACAICHFTPEHGVAVSAGWLCAPCMHETVQECCKCSTSLYWCAEQWGPRVQYLEMMGSPLLQQVRPRPLPLANEPILHTNVLPRQPPPDRGSNASFANPETTRQLLQPACPMGVGGTIGTGAQPVVPSPHAACSQVPQTVRQANAPGASAWLDAGSSQERLQMDRLCNHSSMPPQVDRQLQSDGKLVVPTSDPVCSILMHATPHQAPPDRSAKDYSVVRNTTGLALHPSPTLDAGSWGGSASSWGGSETEKRGTAQQLVQPEGPATMDVIIAPHVHPAMLSPHMACNQLPQTAPMDWPNQHEHAVPHQSQRDAHYLAPSSWAHGVQKESPPLDGRTDTSLPYSKPSFENPSMWQTPEVRRSIGTERTDIRQVHCQPGRTQDAVSCGSSCGGPGTENPDAAWQLLQPVCPAALGASVAAGFQPAMLSSRTACSQIPQTVFAYGPTQQPEAMRAASSLEYDQWQDRAQLGRQRNPSNLPVQADTEVKSDGKLLAQTPAGHVGKEVSDNTERKCRDVFTQLQSVHQRLQNLEALIARGDFENRKG